MIPSPPATKQQSQKSRQLIECCAKGNLKGLDELTRNGIGDIDANITDGEGNTPLILSAQAGYTPIVELLIERFPVLNIDQMNNLGQTALMKAAIQGRVSCARMLLRAGSDPYRRDISRGLCALEWAEYVGRNECAHMIAHFMLQPAKTPPKKLSVVGVNDFQQIIRVTAVPLMGEVPLQRPRLGSAPAPTIPKLEISECEEPHRKHSTGKSLRRPHSSMA